MDGKWIKIENADDQKEVIVNIASIWKIEVSYIVPHESPPPSHATIGLEAGRKDPSAIRKYKAFVGGHHFTLPADPNNPAVKILEEIYKHAIPV